MATNIDLITVMPCNLINEPSSGTILQTQSRIIEMISARSFATTPSLGIAK
jgi:hypothetical protein